MRNTAGTFPRANADAGRNWFGTIPPDWAARPLRALARVLGGGTPSKNNDAFWEGDIPWVSPKDMKSRVIWDSEDHVTPQGVSDSATQIVPQESVLVVFRSGILRHTLPTAIAGRAVAINQDMKAFVCRPNFLPWFLEYTLQGLGARLLALWRNEGATVESLDLPVAMRTRFPMPPVITQRGIADYLDSETRRIDALIAAKRRMVELLAEHETTLVHELTSRGLRRADTAESGVPWLGSVPKHWGVMQIRRIGYVRRGASPRPIDDPVYFDDDGEYAWVRIADVTDSGRYLTTTTQRLSSLGSSLSAKLAPGSLFISIAGSVGKAMITSIKCCVHDGFVYFERLRVRPDYLYYLFRAGQLFQGLGKLGTQLNLNTETVGAIVIPVPPLDEQDMIVAELDRRIQQNDRFRTLVNRQIGLLQERRQALITDAVTGQLEIPEAA